MKEANVNLENFIMFMCDLDKSMDIVIDFPNELFYETSLVSCISRYMMIYHDKMSVESIDELRALSRNIKKSVVSSGIDNNYTLIVIDTKCSNDIKEKIKEIISSSSSRLSIKKNPKRVGFEKEIKDVIVRQDSNPISPSIELKRFYIQFLTGNYEDEGCTQSPFSWWNTGRERKRDKSDRTDMKLVTVIEAEQEELALALIDKHFPNFELVACAEISEDFIPPHVKSPDMTKWIYRMEHPASENSQAESEQG